MIARAPVSTRFSRAAPWISTVVRLTLAGVFLAAGGLKVIDVATSVASVRAYELLPAGLERLVGWGLPFVEIALGLLLAAGAFLRVVGAVSAVMMAGFIAAVISAAARGLSIDCGCFGGGGTVAPGQTDYTAEIIRDTLFLLLALWLVWQPRSRLALEPQPLEPRDRGRAQ